MKPDNVILKLYTHMPVGLCGTLVHEFHSLSVPRDGAQRIVECFYGGGGYTSVHEDTLAEFPVDVDEDVDAGGAKEVVRFAANDTQAEGLPSLISSDGLAEMLLNVVAERCRPRVYFARSDVKGLIADLVTLGASQRTHTQEKKA